MWIEIAGDNQTHNCMCTKNTHIGSVLWRSLSCNCAGWVSFGGVFNCPGLHSVLLWILQRPVPLCGYGGNYKLTFGSGTRLLVLPGTFILIFLLISKFVNTLQDLGNGSCHRHCSPPQAVAFSSGQLSKLAGTCFQCSSSNCIPGIS